MSCVNRVSFCGRCSSTFGVRVVLPCFCCCGFCEVVVGGGARKRGGGGGSGWVDALVMINGCSWSFLVVREGCWTLEFVLLRFR